MKKGIVCSIVLQSGGTGKSTATFNLGKCLSAMGYKVLAIDNDTQSDLMPAIFGRTPKGETLIPKEVLSLDDNGMVKLNKANTLNLYIQNAQVEPMKVSDNFYYIGATKHLEQAIGMSYDDAVFEFADKIEALKSQFDFILIDCLPTECNLQKAALYASDYALLPVFSELKYLGGVAGIIQLINTTKKRLNPKLKILGILITSYNNRKFNPFVEREFNQVLYENYSDLVFEKKISHSYKIKESNAMAQAIVDYMPNGESAEEYRNVTKEFLNKVGVDHE